MYGEVVHEVLELSGYQFPQIAQDYWMVRGLYGIARNLPADGWLRAGLTPKQVRKGVSPERAKRVGRWAFAGGTSLTAAWKVVERYSEDIDSNLFVAGQSTSKNATRQARRRVLQWVSGQTGAERISMGSGAVRIARFAVPDSEIAFAADATALPPDPEGELVSGCRVDSIIGRTLPELLDDYPELGGFRLPCVVPQFTAANKLDALHRRNAHERWDALSGRVRDILDLSSIADSRHADATRSSVPSLVDRMEGGFGPQAERPENGYGSSDLYAPGSPGYERLRGAWHHALPAMLPGRAGLPDFDASMAKARTLDLV
jgi:hypothetical protein